MRYPIWKYVRCGTIRWIGFKLHEGQVSDFNKIGNETKHRVYQSAVDTWLIFLLYVSPVSLASLGVYLATVAQADEALTCFVMALAVTMLNISFTRPCRYTLTADSLNIRCGLLSQTIALERIQSAELSSSWQNGYALSLKRVCIKLDKGQRLVSPVDREQFITELMQAVEKVKRSKA